MRLFIGLLAGLLLVGCSITPIANTGYGDGKPQNELREISVITAGEESDALISEVKPIESVTIPHGSSVMLMQSSARYPEHALVSALSTYWNISPADGTTEMIVRQEDNSLIRNMARMGGNSHVIVCWGEVSTMDTNLATRVISWIPFIGWNLWDQETEVKTQLKFALIDVETGRWRLVQPNPAFASYKSSLVSRRGKGRTEIEGLKSQLYKSSIVELVTLAHSPR